MKVLYKQVGKDWLVRDVDNTLEQFQKMVGGYIETVPFYSSMNDDMQITNMVIVANENGLIGNLHFNLKLCGYHLFGNVVVVGTDGDDFCDVSDDAIKMVRLGI